MIKGLEIKNFQSHKHTQIDFDPGVNVIIGATDAGKSAIFRSMLWALFNRPLGRGFITNGEENCSVKMVLNDCCITRTVSKTENHYKLDDTLFKAIGRNPPEEILNAHALHRDLNIQTQIDPFFLLQSSSGDVAKYLNKVASLDIIDETIHNLHSKYHRVSQDVTKGTAYLGELHDELQSYEYLDETETELKRATVLEKELDSIRTQYSQINKACAEIHYTLSILKKNKESITHKELVNDALQLLNADKVFVNKQSDIIMVLDDINDIIEAISELESDSINSDLLEKALELDAQICTAETTKNNLEIVVNQIKNIDIALEKYTAELGVLKTQFKNSMPEICPLCENIICKENNSTQI